MSLLSMMSGSFMWSMTSILLPTTSRGIFFRKLLSSILWSSYLALLILSFCLGYVAGVYEKDNGVAAHSILGPLGTILHLLALPCPPKSQILTLTLFFLKVLISTP